MGTISIGHHSLIAGGTFTQVNNNQIQQSPEDRLQAAVAHAAFHNSAERFDPPKCHPNTRVAVMDDLIDWVRRKGAVGHKAMLWVCGAAGAGKSAIAQSLCEICFANKFLLAAFFFNRSDPSRNNPKRLVATLAYQIYGMIPPHYQDQILEVVRIDPLVFERAMEAQLKALIIEPLRGLFERDYFNNYDAPRLIVLDGVDECSTGAVQVELLMALQAMLAQANMPFIILVASRPEHDIQTYFRSARLETPIHRLDLDDSYRPDADISLFVRDRLTEIHESHPLKGCIPKHWPPDEVIEAIVRKSSGQFIYASVVVKYVTSTRHYPPDRLDVIRHLRPAKRSLPFAELDALYSHIFSCVDDTPLVLQIIQVALLFVGVSPRPSVRQIEAICGLRQGECFSALCDLQSVLELPLDPTEEISFLHKSLPDYLQDPARSLGYHVTTTPEAALPIFAQCLKLISASKTLADADAYLNFIASSKYSKLFISNTQQLDEGIRSCSLGDKRSTEIMGERWREKEGLGNLPYFAIRLVDALHALQGTEYEYLYWHHLCQAQKIALEVFDNNNHDWGNAMVIVLILSEKSTTSVSPVVLQFPSAVTEKPSSGGPCRDIIDNLSCAAALRCINTLKHDSITELISFALEWLPFILRQIGGRRSRTVYDACLPANIPILSTGTGNIPSNLVSEIEGAMAQYRWRYERVLAGGPFDSDYYSEYNSDSGTYDSDSDFE